MDFILTEHARDALAKRGISITWVERVFHSPEAIEPDRIDPELEHRLARIPELENRVLRVIVNVTVEPKRIVTLFLDRRSNLP
ncbi:MAG: DUF4258 domain-containing protein [Chloroflexi bacterium CFX6]|nr:DUF4258 domain-containing protein [Chloroflexi bacterium CFX6]